jgi:hypothetical protein
VIPRALSLAILAVGLAACSGGGGGDSPPKLDAGRTRRVIEPPTGKVRPLPPHAIDPGGIGPYRLGVSQAEVLAVIPPPPRMTTLEVDQVLEAQVVRAEDDAILAGGRRGEPISFVAALAPGIARTETGLGVGARRSELAALGPERGDPRIARDPRIVVPAAMPGVRFLVDNDAVAAILVRAAPEGAADAGGVEGCAAELPASEPDVLGAAGLAGLTRVLPSCLGGSGREAVVVAGDVIVVVDADGARTRKVAKQELRGLVWAAPVRSEPDRDDLVAITERRDGDELVLALHAFRLDGGRLVPLVEEDVYRLTETKAQWIGARVADLRLLSTVEARSDGYEVGGVLLHLGASGVAVRVAAPLLPRLIPRKRRTGGEPAPAPVRDAGAPSADAAPAPRVP